MSDIPSHLHETLAGRYVLKREIGRGGAATVYLAHDVRHERLVAIKLLHPELSHALGAQRFLREIKLTASLQHPHILAIYDSGEAHDQLYYVMPYVEGDSMRQRLTADSRMSVEEAVRIGREVAGALSFAHERGIVHRDIKPENILFSGGHAVLADFGIARAIDRAHEKITQQGTITGTPAYMSPEQARDRAFDGRSDVYSLASVLYEAIAGIPPFVGDSPQQLLTQRISKRAPLLREFRHDVPAPIEAVIAKALSISPDDRFDDARAFSAALSGAIGHSGEIRQGRVARRPLSRSGWVWAAAAVIVMTVSAASTERGRDQLDVLTGRVDTAQYAIMPFQYVGTPAPARDQEPVSQGLYAAMREWNGLKLVSDMSVYEAASSTGDETLQHARSVARHVRAGKLVWGRVSLTRDSMFVSARVYDAITGASLREITIPGTRNMLQTNPGTLRVLAADLLRLDASSKLSKSADVGTRTLAAWRAYQEGQVALITWRVPVAVEAFERAIDADPDYAYPQVWLAQLLVWRAEKPVRWAPHVSTASRGRAALAPRELSLLDALEAIQNGKLGDACAAYDAIRSRDSLDAVAWLGLAHCRGFDRIVTRDARGVLSFRGSVAGAQRAYERALQLSPSSFCVFPFNSVLRLFTIERSRVRWGMTTDSTPVFGLPNLVGDSVSTVARPQAELTSASFETLAPNYSRAIQRNRDLLLAILSSLTQRLPDNPEVFEALAQVLETRDELTGTPNGGHSALSALERAKLLAAGNEQRARVGAADVRLHLKLGDFSRAAAIGDSVLAAMPDTKNGGAVYLAGIASLLGKESRAIRYIQSSGYSLTAGGVPTVPMLEDVAAAYFVRASLGVCDDSLRTLGRRVDALLESYVSAAQRDSIRTSVLTRPLQFAVSCLGLAPTLTLRHRPSLVMGALQLVAREKPAAATALLDTITTNRRGMRAGEYAVDLTVAEAWLRATTGDSAGAIRQLDLTLTALPTLSPHLLYEMGMAAAVGRSMVLRAELAARTGDPATAALWAGRVLTLWARSERSLVPTLERMRALVAHRARS